MRCKTRKEKFMELMEDVRRFFLITVVTVVGTAIAAFILCFMMTMSENRSLKLENEILKQKIEAYSEEEKSNTTTYQIVVDEKTGRVIYADF